MLLPGLGALPSEEIAGWVDTAVQRDVGAPVLGLDVVWSGAGVVVVLAETERGPVVAVHTPAGESVTAAIGRSRGGPRVAVTSNGATDASGATLDDLDMLDTYRDELALAGIDRPGALAVADPHVLAQSTGAPVATVKRWQAAAEFLGLDGVGPREATLLALAGVDGVTDLARRAPNALLDELERRRERDALDDAPFDALAVAEWVEAARRHLREARRPHGGFKGAGG